MTKTGEPSHWLTGLFETHIWVADLERAMAFYGEVLGLELGMREDRRRVAFYWIGGWGRALLGVWESRDGAPIAEQHFAFELDLADLEREIAALKAKGVVLRNFFDEATDVPSVFGWIPAASIYFRDPDGHLLEVLARLPGNPERGAAVVPLTEWRGRGMVHG